MFLIVLWFPHLPLGLEFCPVCTGVIAALIVTAAARECVPLLLAIGFVIVIQVLRVRGCRGGAAGHGRRRGLRLRLRDLAKATALKEEKD